MQTKQNIPLSELTTMRLGGPARAVVTVSTREELEEAVKNCGDTPYFVLGGGSNVIARDEGFEGTIILNRIVGFDVIEDDKHHLTLHIGAGENWDRVVERAVAMDLSGIEALSAIPGTAGATPVQNVGAYGQEIADTLVELEAYDTLSGQFMKLTRDECGFSYRNSIFKNPSTRHHIITHITLRLNKKHLSPPFYASLHAYLDEHHITDHSPASIRQAVIAIRAQKLPDPRLIANTGSFFKNPIVNEDQAAKLVNTYETMPQFPMSDGRVKLAAGWLIENAGLKGYRSVGFRTYEHNALVIVNESASSYAHLLQFKNDIVERVHEKFGIMLEQEPETL